jgi:hypothetical protein
LLSTRPRGGNALLKIIVLRRVYSTLFDEEIEWVPSFATQISIAICELFVINTEIITAKFAYPLFPGPR